jgi:Predicted periplasmic lipoprotein (DUF2279)
VTAPDDPNKPKRRLRLVWIISSGVYAALMLGLGYAWYSPQWISSFHFFDDLPEWQQMDKVAHFFWAFQVSVVATRLFRWAAVEEKKAIRNGAWLAFGLVSGIEIFDGFSTAYGASVYLVRVPLSFSRWFGNASSCGPSSRFTPQPLPRCARKCWATGYLKKF